MLMCVALKMVMRRISWRFSDWERKLPTMSSGSEPPDSVERRWNVGAL